MVQIYTMDLSTSDNRQVFWVSEKGTDTCFIINGNDDFPVLFDSKINDKTLAYLAQQTIKDEYKKRGWKLPSFEKFEISRLPISSGKLKDAVTFTWN